MEFQGSRPTPPKFNSASVLERRGRIGVEVAMPYELVLDGEPRRMKC